MIQQKFELDEATIKDLVAEFIKARYNLQYIPSIEVKCGYNISGVPVIIRITATASVNEENGIKDQTALNVLASGDRKLDLTL